MRDVKIKFPERSCHDCGNYPCFYGIDKCLCDFASYGCTYFHDRKRAVDSKE